jgi:very-short-patch-repair endonuclease
VDESRTLHPDLGDPNLGVLVEAEGFADHGTREGHDSDCLRYNVFTLLRWILMRFTWRQVMSDPAYVFDTLVGLVQVARLRASPHADVAPAA